MSTLQYIIVGDTTCDNLSKRVQQQLDDGWQLFGTPYCSQGWQYQAMTKDVQPAAVRGTVRGLSG